MVWAFFVLFSYKKIKPMVRFPPPHPHNNLLGASWMIDRKRSPDGGGSGGGSAAAACL